MTQQKTRENVSQRIFDLRQKATTSPVDMETFLRALRSAQCRYKNFNVVETVNKLPISRSAKWRLIQLFANRVQITPNVVAFAYQSVELEACLRKLTVNS